MGNPYYGAKIFLIINIVCDHGVCTNIMFFDLIELLIREFNTG